MSEKGSKAESEEAKLEEAKLEEAELRAKIKNQLILSGWYHEAAKEVLKAKIGNEMLRNREIRKVAEKYSISRKMEFSKLKKTVDIVEQKEDFLALRNRIKSALKELKQSNTFQIVTYLQSVSEKHKIPLELLSSEYDKQQKCGNLYRFDKRIMIKNNERFFTYLDEFSMLVHLYTWKTDNDYKCHCQVCVLVYLHKWAYEFAKENKIKQIPGTWKEQKAASIIWVMEYEIRHSREIISNFDAIEKCKNEPQSTSSTNWGQSSYDILSDLSTSHVLQWSFQSFQEVSDIPRTIRALIRKEIKIYLKSEGYLERAAIKVFDGLNVEIIAQNYRLDPSLLQSKVYIMRKKKHYWKVKNKIEEIIKCVFSEENIHEIMIELAAKKLDISATVFTDEIKKYKSLYNKTLYEYEKLSASGEFTYKEEFFLLKQLSFLTYNLQSCRCKVCVLECFGSLAFKFAQHKNKQCYSVSKYLNLNLNWLILFMMGYTKQISILKFSNSCNVDPQTSMSVLQSSLSSDQ